MDSILSVHFASGEFPARFLTRSPLLFFVVHTSIKGHVSPSDNLSGNLRLICQAIELGYEHSTLTLSLSSNTSFEKGRKDSGCDLAPSESDSSHILLDLITAWFVILWRFATTFMCVPSILGLKSRISTHSPQVAEPESAAENAVIKGALIYSRCLRMSHAAVLLAWWPLQTRYLPRLLKID